MGDCIICGTSTDGPICETHQEDVVFEFRGERPDQLTEGRFYRGTVDGYADFGVFVDLSDGVTGLLHRSKLDRRLESLDWEPGDTVYVQVTNVRDNGDIDLGWSIRQSDREFRGVLVDAPGGDRLLDEGDDDRDEPRGESGGSGATAADAEQPGDGSQGGEGQSANGAPVGESSGGEQESGQEAAGRAGAEPESDDRGEPADGGEPETTDSGKAEPADSEESDAGSDADTAPDRGEAADAAPSRVSVADLREHVGSVVRLEGEVVSVRQTSGPTVFEVRDETAVVDCAAFEEAGVRAYPEVETSDVVRLDGEVRVRRDELQLETEALVVLEGEEREAVEDRMARALADAAAPETVEPLADDPAVAAATDAVREAATTIRRAIMASRPVVVRHDASVDGYVAGAAIERAALPLVREEHAQTDAAYHYFDRRPLEDGVYDMDDATKDVTNMLDDAERHDEKLPLFVFAAAGGTDDSADGLAFLDVYDVERVVVDGRAVDETVADTADCVVAPGEPRTASTVAATVAGAVNDAIREDLQHLPAVSYWADAPEVYTELASEAGVDAEAVERLREAIALEAYYQSYEDKRELIIDLLFDRQHGLAEQVSSQFRTKLAAELETAEANLESRAEGGVTVTVLDTDAYTHRFDFPPAKLLLDELHRRNDADVTVGLATDALYLRGLDESGVRAVAERVRERVPTGGVTPRGVREGKLEFLSGERDEVLAAVVEAVAEERSAQAA